MKNWTKKLALVAAAALLTGCGTVQGVVETISGGGITELFNPVSGGSGRSAGTASGAAGTGIVSRPSRNYTLPESYETVYSYRTGAPDQNMKTMPQNIEAHRAGNPAEYVRQAAALINGSAKNDFEKAKKAHDLVAVLVKYDAANFWAGTVPDQSYQSVLRSRLAVCEGYANLFKKLCDELKIPCEVVHGFARGVGTSPLVNDTPNNANHAWNIVTLNGESYLVDSTWDSGFMDGKVAKQRYTTDWLFLKPEQFLYTHYPENPKQQLLATPLAAAEFSALPFFTPRFFDLVDTVSIAIKKINQVDNALSFEYTIKDGYSLTFNMHDITTGREIQNRSFVQKDGTKERVSLSFPAAGQYSVNMFSWKTGSRQGDGCGEFVVTAASANATQYPTIYSSSAKNLQIISPVEMPLKKGNTYAFKIRVDNKKVVAIIYGKTLVQLQKGADGIFTADFTAPATIKELSIGIADSERGQYESIAKYTVN